MKKPKKNLIRFIFTLLIFALFTIISRSGYLDGLYNLENNNRVFQENEELGDEFTLSEIEACRKGNSGYELSELDSLGRAGKASACLDRKLLPTANRESLSYNPTGWNQKKYQDEDGEFWLYNRSHLLAFSLTGLNDEPRNLITGTKQFNQIEMQKYEQPILSYIRNGGKVLYRVTPVYDGNNLLSNGVQLQACSVEDECREVNYGVFISNEQENIIIDYTTGNSYEAD